MRYYKCIMCRDKRITNRIDGRIIERHRIKPGEAGGRYTWDNILLVCYKCHAEIHARMRSKFGKTIYQRTFDEYLNLVNEMLPEPLEIIVALKTVKRSNC